MTEKGYMSDIYKQLEECIKKCDSLSHEIKTVKKDTEKKYKKQIKDLKAEYNDKILKLEAEIKIKDKKIEKLENELDRLKSQLNKDSNNSSKPPSTDIKPNKKDIPHNRENLGKKSGGQKGHKGKTISKEYIKEQIKKNTVKHEIVNHGNINSNKYIVKYEICTDLVVTVKEHRFYPDNKGKYNIDNRYKNNVFYSDEVKALCSYLSVQNSMPLNKIVTTIKDLTKGILKISEGTVMSFLYELNDKSENVLEYIKNKLLNSDLMYTDETSSRCNGKRSSIRNYSNEKYVWFASNKTKSKKCIEGNNILNVYVGDVVHDHETAIYSYGKKHVECNVHVCRYLKGIYENTYNSWSYDMRKLLLKANITRSIAKKYGLEEFEEEIIQRYEKEYDEILESGFEQNKETKSKVYKEDEKKLLNRLKKYKENHLLFIHNFSMPFDNNLSERDIRIFKSKTKVSGGFRSEKGQETFANIISIIKTARKKDKYILETILDIYKYSTAII